MKNSSLVDVSDPALVARVRKAAAKAASQSGHYREVQDIEQEVWSALLALDETTTEEQYEAACTSVALYRRAIDYTRSLDPLSRPWRRKLINAVEENSASQSVSETMREIGVPDRMRRRAESFSMASPEDLLIGDAPQDEQIILRHAIQGAIADVVQDKFDELDQAVLQEYLMDKSVVLMDLATRFGVTESAVSLRVKRLRARLQAALERQGITAEDLR
jgi:DNA-directed RNA polymerase specialized sigma24 family protein